jgi:tripartite-type tricarboxylate transporter receptor subunit TctC
MIRKLPITVAVMLFVIAGFADSSLAQFYRGKNITMIINFPAGGPSDIEGRIVAQHLPNHIPGRPTVVVKNVGGAGGIIGSNQLGESPPNGDSIGFFTLDVISEFVDHPSVRTRYADFLTIAGVANPLVVYARKDTPPGLKVATDIMKAKDFKALSLNAQTGNAVNQSLALDILGLQYQAIPAYRGLKDVETAVLQNIGQLANSSLPGWRGSIQTSMGDVVIPLWQLAARGKDGSTPRSPAVPELPTFEEFYASVNNGKPPSGFQYEVLRASTDPVVAMFRTVMMPPRTVDEAVSIMRAAVVNMWKDPAFIRDYTNVLKSPPILVPGHEAQQIIAALGRVKPEIKAYLVEYTNKLVK